MSSQETPPGAFFVIESTDPLIRTEQYERLVTRLEKEGYGVTTVSFPQYDQASSHFAKQYQSGKYGQLDSVGPYTSSVFYALDRFEASKAIREALSDGKVVIANRFTGSNMAQQGTKFESSEQRRGYFLWLDNMEFEMLKVPRPERSFILRLPAELSEPADYEQQKLLVQVYDELAMLFPKDFIRIDCARDGKKVDDHNISQLLYQAIEPLLPAASATNGSVQRLSNPTASPTPAVDSGALHTITGLERLQQPLSGAELAEDKGFYLPPLKGKHKQIFEETLERAYAVRSKLCEVLDTKNHSYADALLPLAAYYTGATAVRPGKFVNKAVQQLAASELKNGHDQDLSAVRLTSVTPRNELDLVADVLYPYTQQSYQQLKTESGQLSYVQKEKVLSAYLQQATKNEQSMDAHYGFDILCDHAVFDTLRQALPAATISLQKLTPRYGYDVPEVIEQSGMVDEYIDCFDRSLTLFSELQAAGFAEAAPYCLLRGHKFRCRFSLDLASLQHLMKAITASPTPGAMQMATNIREVITEAHPLIAAFL